LSVKVVGFSLKHTSYEILTWFSEVNLAKLMYNAYNVELDKNTESRNLHILAV
jgi:hypothetical protein